MYQPIMQYHQNPSPYQVYGVQPGNVQHFVRPQLPVHLSPNVMPMGQANVSCMPPMFLSESMPGATRNSSQFVNADFGSSNVSSTDPYSCHFLAQLEGSYETGLTDTQRVQVELVDGEQYANVRRKDDRGELVLTQLIHEDEKRFRLCSLEGFVLAIMIKGKDMRSSVTWYSNDGSQMVWHRTQDVTFKLVTITPDQSRRNSLASNLSGTSQMSCSQASPSELVSDVRMRIRPELRRQEEPSHGKELTVGEPPKLSSEQLDNMSSGQSPLSEGKSPTASERKLTDDELFDQLKRCCVKCPSLLEKIVHWGITRTPNRRVGSNDIAGFATGRIWVRASLIEPPRGSTESWQEVLNEFKGAYQEAQPDVFMQPPSQPNEPGRRHRIRRNNMGFWVIEEQNVDANVWEPCAQELPYGHWVDLKDNRRRYKIQLVPMLSILNRMQEHWTDHEEMERSIDFLFNSCNQKKLNTRLKARNLKHNISNLRLKLEKQYALSFAVRVAEIADSIALEGQSVGCTNTLEKI